jgi:hypothetical protein
MRMHLTILLCTMTFSIPNHNSKTSLPPIRNSRSSVHLVTLPYFKSVMYNQPLCLLLSSRQMHSAVARSCYLRTLLGLGIRSRHKTCDINRRQPPTRFIAEGSETQPVSKMSMRNDKLFCRYIHMLCHSTSLTL